MSVPDDQPHTRTRYPAGEQPPEPAARRPLRTLAAVLVVVVVLVGAVAVLNRTSGTPTANPGGGGGAGTSGDGAGTSTAATGTQPVTTTRNGIAVGFPHTGEGAQSAAVNYAVALGSADMYAAASRRSIMQTVTDPAVTSGMLAQSDKAYSSQGATFGLTDGHAPAGLTFVSRTIPVGSKIDKQAGDQATVEVWCDALGGLAGQGSTRPVTEYWFTEVLQLHWINGDWKIAAYSQTDGPVPISGNQPASSASTIAGAVTQFGGFRYAR
ncbi:hypothetical protein [Streptacidiphilus sp. PAMC 29251]